MPELRTAPGIYHGIIEEAMYQNGVMWARVWIPAWSNPVQKYITRWARVAIPWGTMNFGMWGSIHAGEHVWVAFEQADPDRPVIIGFVPMPQKVDEQGTTVVEMPPEFVNDCYTSKAPFTGKRVGGQINPAWIAKTPGGQYFLLHDKTQRAIVRVGAAVSPAAAEPKASLSQVNDVGSLAREAIRVLGLEEGVKFLTDVIRAAASAPEFLAREAEKFLQKAVEVGCQILKDMTGVDVSGIVEDFGDLVKQAEKLLGGGE